MEAIPLTKMTSVPAPASARARTYRAAVIQAPRAVEIAEVADPALEPGKARVRVTHCGVCASNVPPWEGRPWFTYPMAPGALGHEAVGIIEEVAEDVSGWAVGDRVAYIGERGYAESEVVPASSLFAIPDELGESLFLAEPLACAMNVFRRAGIQPGDQVAVVGAGFLGTLVTQLAISAGATVFAIGRRPESVELAAQFGAIPLIGEDRGLLAGEIAQRAGGKLCDVVVEATGHQAPLDLAAELTRVRGRLVIAGYHQDGPRSIHMQLWNWRGLDVINAHERDAAVYLEGMRLAAEAMKAGRFSTKGLITHEFPLEQLPDALTMTARRPPGFMKAVIKL